MKRNIFFFFILLVILIAARPASAQECFDYTVSCPQVIEQVPLYGGGLSRLTIDGDRVAATCGSCLNWLTLDGNGISAVVDTFWSQESIVSVDVQGNLAFLALLNSGVQIVDFSTPGAPLLLATIPGLAQTNYVRVDGDFMYVAGGLEGLRILDISDPTAAFQVFSNGHFNVTRVAVADGICWEFIRTGAITGYDVTDPTAPTQIFYRNREIFQSMFLDVEASGGLLRYSRYVFESKEFWCFDVSNPAAPVQLDYLGGDWSYQTGDQTTSYLRRSNEILARGFGDAAGESQIIPTPGILVPLVLRNGLLYGGIGNSLVVIDQDLAPVSPYLGDSMAYVLGGDFIRHLSTAGHLFLYFYVWDPWMPEVDFSIIRIDEMTEDGPVNTGVSINWPSFVIPMGGLAVYGDYLYTGNGIYDWRTRALLGSFFCGRNDVVIGDALYSPGTDGILIYDLAEPTAPEHILTLFSNVDQQSEPVLTGEGVAFTRTIAQNKLKLVSIDVTDPLNPVPLDYLADCGDVIAVDSTTVYLDDGISIELVDASNPQAMVLVGSLARPPLFQGLAARGGAFYLAQEDGILQVGDASDPAAPVLAAPYDLDVPVQGIGLHDWGFFTLVDEALSSNAKGVKCWTRDCSDPGPDYVSAVEDPPGTPQHVLKGILLAQPHPNPFNPSITIRFELSKTGTAELAIYDLAGRRLKTLVHAELQAGPLTVTWDGTDMAGRALPTGAYLVVLRSGLDMESRKIMLIK